ncbi:MAG: heparinase II/III family protein [Clostridia bacterium]|nr:heparinase II/III family protein [Clostridia bacterium]
MYHEFNSYRLLDKERLTLKKEEKQLKYEAFVLGDFIVSFGLALKSGEISGEMCLHGGGTPAYIFDFNGKDVVTRYTKEFVTTLSEKKTDISVFYSVERRRFDIYVDGKLTVENYYAASGIPINCDKLADFFFTFKTEDEAEIELTDLLAHSTACKVDGAVVYDPNNTYAKRKIEVELTDKNYFPEEESDKVALEGAIAVHMRSGVMYRDGKKLLSVNTPYYDGEVKMVSRDELSQMLNDEEREAISTLVNTTRDGVIYVSLDDVAKALGRELYYDNTTINFGMALLANGEFTLPNDTNTLQKLNDFVFYFRPSKEKVKADYDNSALAGVHPRLVATESDFERLRCEIRDNTHKARWFKSLISFCDGLKDKPVLRYELRDGVRLLYVSWDLQRYAVTLALAYKLTGERKYFDYAWPHLKACAEMPDWNPSHHIDVGTLAYGYAIAYDWFYDVMTDEQRKIMEKGAYENVFYTVNRAVENKDTPYCNILMTNNHNVFCNAGVMATVLAFMDAYPDVASKIGADVVRILEPFMDKFAPMGAYYEGPYYAETAINYTVRVFAAMQPVLGTLYGLDKAQGFDGIADFVVLLQSDVAAYNFADSKMSLLDIAGMFWIFDHYGRRGLKDSLAEKNFRDSSAQVAAEAILWYNVNDDGECNLATEIHYPNEEIISMRDEYRDGQTFVGIKAGKTVYAHSHLDAGSFVFDALGRRWAYDFGQDNYNLYYKYNHWDVFRLRAESHNTLVINPDHTPGFVLGSEAPVSEFTVTPGRVKTVIEKTALYGAERGVEYARRGYLFTDGRSSLVSRDEVKLTRESSMIWLMYTDADIEIDGNVATLRDKVDTDKHITVEFTANHPFEIGFEDAKPLPTSPDIPEQAKNIGFHRLYLRLTADGDVSITVKINSRHTDTTPLGDYDMSIDKWEC